MLPASAQHSSLCTSNLVQCSTIYTVVQQGALAWCKPGGMLSCKQMAPSHLLSAVPTSPTTTRQIICAGINTGVVKLKGFAAWKANMMRKLGISK